MVLCAQALSSFEIFAEFFDSGGLTAHQTVHTQECINQKNLITA